MYTASLTIASAVNNDDLLRANLAASPCIARGKCPFIYERGLPSAAVAYNRLLSRAESDLVVFAHQDVYLPNGWEHRLSHAISRVSEAKRPWAVLGVLGLSRRAQLIGRMWCAAWGREWGGEMREPTEAICIDEIVLVVRRSTGIRFDEGLPGYHLYGTDIVLTAREHGFGAYVFEGPVVHNTAPVRFLDRQYRKGYRFMQRKWRNHLPLPTLVVPITRFGWPLVRQELRYVKRSILKSHRPVSRILKPSELAMRLGYEVLA